MIDGVRNSAKAMLERKSRANERRNLDFMDRFWGVVRLLVLARRKRAISRISGGKVDHEDIFKDRFKDRNKGLMVGVWEIFLSGFCLVEGNNEAVRKSLV